MNVLGIDPLDYEKVSGLTFKNGDAAEIYQTLQQLGTLIATPILATSLGLKEGDTLELASPKGIKSYQVIALGTDYLNAKQATAYLSIPNLEADFQRHADVLLQIGLTQQANRESVAAAIKPMLASYPQFKVISGQQYIEENMSLLKVATIGMDVLMLFLAIPSLLGMLNSLAIGVIERTREIGMLRAVGATVRQVRVMISVKGDPLDHWHRDWHSGGAVPGLYRNHHHAGDGLSDSICFSWPSCHCYPVGGDCFWADCFRCSCKASL